MPLIEIEEAADKRDRGGKEREGGNAMETHSAAQQGEGVAVAVAVAVTVVAADKERQQQHYTHHYVERFSVIDDMGPLRDCLEIPEDSKKCRPHHRRRCVQRFTCRAREKDNREDTNPYTHKHTHSYVVALVHPTKR